MSALRLPALALTALLCACATQEPLPQPPNDGTPPLSEAVRWQQHLQTLAPLSDWTAQGKVGYRLPDDAGSASLRWEQRGDDSEVRLAGPLGSGATVIRNDGPLLRVSRDGIDRLYPADAAPWLGDGRLLPVPVSALHHWLLGRPDPAQPIQVVVTENGLAQHLAQDGWRIVYTDYDRQGAQILPARITLTAPDDSVELRVILRDWEFTGAQP